MEFNRGAISRSTSMTCVYDNTAARVIQLTWVAVLGVLLKQLFVAVRGAGHQDLRVNRRGCRLAWGPEVHMPFNRSNNARTARFECSFVRAKSKRMTWVCFTRSGTGISTRLACGPGAEIPRACTLYHVIGTHNIREYDMGM